jgi:thiamine-phosphate pyrophosphorylase
MRMTVNDHFGFYAVLTNPVMGYPFLTELLVDNGIAFVQLRMKEEPREEIIRVAEQMRRITLGTPTRFIVNDHPDIAMQTGADGVHIGQNDLPYATVRATVGEKMIIGLSTHSPQQTQSACALKPDYIGIGPVFATPTKKNPDPVIGIEGMRIMLSCATVPPVAIGGIDLDNLRLVLEAGARNFCMVRQLTQSKEPAKVLKEMLHVYHDYYPQ